MESAARPSPGQWILGFTVAGIGVGWQYGSLWLVERWVTDFPGVPDVVMDRLPRMEFGWWGEALFFVVVGLFAFQHFRWHWRATPKVLTTLGLWYFVRGFFMLLLPIGAPLDSVPPDQRLNIWGYATHAFFPGGHIGVLMTLAYLTPRQPWRAMVWVGVILFGLGTLMAKNHYTIDSLASLVLSYGIWSFVDRRWKSS